MEYLKKFLKSLEERDLFGLNKFMESEVLLVTFASRVRQLVMESGMRV